MRPVVLFDFHETLVQLEPSTDSIFADIVGVPPERCRAIFAAVEPAVERLRAEGQWPPPTQERWALLYDLILDSLDLPGTGRDVAARIGEHFNDPGAYSTYPEVPQMLEALRESGARMGILSNTDLDLWPLLRHLGVDDYFDAAVPAFLHGVEKPDPAAFDLALGEIGAAPEATWFVGDSPRHDVLPAAALGMSPVLVDRLGVHADSSAYVRVPTLERLPSLVAEQGPRPAPA